MRAAVRTTCPYCGVGCGVLARRSGAAVDITGDPLHPANFGSLYSKGSALGETLGGAGRLLHPQVRGRRVDWDEALTSVAQGFAAAVRDHGPEAVAFYVSGQLLTEDYYVANKLMKGFLGSANIDTNSRLCMASAVAGHKRAFGEDLVPGCYEDLELADLIVLVGSNTAWCHPVLFRRIEREKQRRPQLKLIVIDPRRTPTSELADLHLPIRAGTDVNLFNGLLWYLDRHGAVDADYLHRHANGAEEALEAARAAGDPPQVATVCGADAERIGELYRLFCATERVVTAFSQGVNQSSAGTDKVNSIINCHLLTGRIGRPGMGPLSLTGQPNAMGGREVGGLANTLAAHFDLESEGHRAAVQEFWRSPRIASRPGLKAVELFEAMHAGRIKAVWIMATNPVVSLPDADRAREALRRCELVVVSDCAADTDTTALAHVLLPAAGWGEKDGTVTNSERRISRQRQFLTPLGEARPDWWIVSEVGRRMGFEEAKVRTHWGSMVARVRISGEVPRGALFVPMHWNDCHASEGRVGALVNPVVDPLSGEPEFKHTPANIHPFPVEWYGVVLARWPIEARAMTWWTLIYGAGFLRYELAGREVPADWAQWVRDLLGSEAPDADYVEYCDATAGVYRAAYVSADRLEACAYFFRRPELPARAWPASLFAKEKLEASERTALLAGRPLRAGDDAGALVCSCFGVGRHTLHRLIASEGLTDARQVGERLRAGTNCGSCLPEIRALLAVAREGI
jgi:anaerobic selenocysteine-containing dehydrogenase/bacterioferritin-associated ferredoxin